MVRYHSLAVEPATLPACLEPIAWARGVMSSGAQPVKGPALQSPAIGAATESRLGKNGISPQLHVHVDSRASCAAADAAEPSVLMGLAHRERPHYAVSGSTTNVLLPGNCWLAAGRKLALLMHTTS